MSQLHLPGLAPLPAEHVVSVASVKHRSPFRYRAAKPGWCRASTNGWTAFLDQRVCRAFCWWCHCGIDGSGASGRRATLVEIDQVAAVPGDDHQSRRRFASPDRLETSSSQENVERLLSQDDPTPQAALRPSSESGGGFWLRVQAGSSLRNGRGISSLVSATLRRRIMDYAIRDRLSFIHGDGLESYASILATTGSILYRSSYTASEKKPGSRLHSLAGGSCGLIPSCQEVERRLPDDL